MYIYFIQPHLFKLYRNNGGGRWGRECTWHIPWSSRQTIMTRDRLLLQKDNGWHVLRPRWFHDYTGGYPMFLILGIMILLPSVSYWSDAPFILNDRNKLVNDLFRRNSISLLLKCRFFDDITSIFCKLLIISLVSKRPFNCTFGHNVL